MELIEWILRDKNFSKVIQNVKKNKGAPGVDGMTVNELEQFFEKNGELIKEQILNKKYKPDPVKRVYIP